MDNPVDSDFAAFWTSRYHSAKPTGWLMRSALARWWIRFHSLPLSKRYADTDEERSILLDRQNHLAAAVLGEGQSCWLVQSHWITPDGGVDLAVQYDPFRESREYQLKPAFSFRRGEDDDDEPEWNVLAGIVSWERGRFDDTLLRIADERAGPTLWMSANDGAVFAPYDGGVDLFLPQQKARDALRLKFADWLPSHPDGL